MNYIISGDSLQELKKLPDNSIDSVVTDPPYHLTSITKRFGKKDAAPASTNNNDGSFARLSKGFMGKEWDGVDENGVGIANNVELWEEVLRVLKPGGHMLAFSGTRTYHRMVVAIEDAGFEIRDMINWTYGSGFPKNHDIGKAIDKKLGNERTVVGEGMHSNIHSFADADKYTGTDFKPVITKGNTKWEGFGTALKPSHEPIVLARKPVEGTIADNVLTYGTGAINIDDSRIPANWEEERPASWFNSGKSKSGEATYGGNLQTLTDSTLGERLHDNGRYPANTILSTDPEVAALFPDSKGAGPSLPKVKVTGYGTQIGQGTYEYESGERIPFNAGEGSAARFFQQIEYDPIIYQAKAGKKERNKGLDHLPDRPSEHNSGGIGRKVSVEKRLDKEGQNAPTMKNTHPTVKPIKLMEYLVKMITPPGGVVLDPFAGSGTTLIAAKTQGFNYIGIELTPEYVEIAEARLKAY